MITKRKQTNPLMYLPIYNQLNGKVPYLVWAKLIAKLNFNIENGKSHICYYIEKVKYND